MRFATLPTSSTRCSCSRRPRAEGFGTRGGPARVLRSLTAAQQPAQRAEAGVVFASSDAPRGWGRSPALLRAMASAAEAAQLDGASAPQAQQLDGDRVEAAPAAVPHSPSEEFPPHVLRTLWDSVARPLLRVGKSGVQRSHLTSLGELLGAHGLVKVQLNAVNSDVQAVGAELADGTGGTLVLAKGRTLLLGAPRHDSEALMAVARHSMTRSTEAAERKVAAKERKSQDAELSVTVEAKLRSLISGRVLSNTDFDSHSLRSLAALPDAAALGVLQGCTKVRLRGVRNKSAWLTSQCRRQK